MRVTLGWASGLVLLGGLALAFALEPLSAPAWAAVAPAAAPPPRNTCLDCHRQLDDRRLSAPTKDFAQDIHAVRGLGCSGCHGGNPRDPEMTAMDPEKGFKPAPAKKDIAELCASCHANAAYMKHFNPQPYVFSMAEFRTSVHCKLIEEGDPKVATCTNCHGVHGILQPRDPRSPVYPINVAFTCSKCHNAEYMKGRKVTTGQFELWRKGVHGEALLGRHELSAPACNDCHGNHGARPPETRDISLVCANCHGREGELFAKSKVKATLEFEGKRGCVTCHGNHDIHRPSDAMIGFQGEGLCGRCHAADSPGARAAAIIVPSFHGFKARIAQVDSLLNAADRLGMETESGRDLLKQASDQLVGLRAAVHSFELEPIQAALAEGTRLADRAESEARSALHDWRNRRIGMALSLVVILALIGLLVAWIRVMGSGVSSAGDVGAR